MGSVPLLVTMPLHIGIVLGCCDLRFFNAVECRGPARAGYTPGDGFGRWVRRRLHGCSALSVTNARSAQHTGSGTSWLLLPTGTGPLCHTLPKRPWPLLGF